MANSSLTFNAVEILRRLGPIRPGSIAAARDRGSSVLRQIAGCLLAALALTTAAACGTDTSTPSSPAATIPPPYSASATPSTTTLRPVGGPGPASGAVLARVGTGQGTLSVDNGTSRDAVVTLARGSTAALRVYVRAGDTARVTRVADGIYTLYATSGVGWDSTTRAFVSEVDAQRFDETFEYTTDSGASTQWSITLQPVVGGSASTSGVDAATVPG